MSMIYGDDPTCGIKKRVLHSGKGNEPDYPDGTKVFFYYQARKCDDTHTVLDDNRKDDKPLELYIGKKFKLEVWEKCLKTMRSGEVASFTVHESLVNSYPLVAKSLRDIRSGKPAQGHCCGVTMAEHGLGYPDLNDLMKKPEPLEFILDLKRVEVPGEYKKEAWAMEEGEKIEAIPRLREEGNTLYKASQYAVAADKYAEAIGMLEQLLLREKPNDEEWEALFQKKIPLLLNFSQCKLQLGEYYQVIEHTSEVIKKDPDNVKALYRRAKAHIGAWNVKEARSDFGKVVQLDPSLLKSVNKDLKSIEEMEKLKDEEDKAIYAGKIF